MPKTKLPEDIKKLVAYHEAELAKLKSMPEEWKPWEPELNENYYYLDSKGKAFNDRWDGWG